MTALHGFRVSMTTMGTVTPGPQATCGGYRYRGIPGWRPDAPDEAADLLTSADIMWAAGMTYRQLDFAVRTGRLQPDRTWRGRRTGSGSPRVWSRAELKVAQTMARLVRAGLPLDAAARIARSGEPRIELVPGVWLELGSPLSAPCERGDCEMCFPGEPADCGHGCHQTDGGGR